MIGCGEAKKVAITASNSYELVSHFSINLGDTMIKVKLYINEFLIT